MSLLVPFLNVFDEKHNFYIIMFYAYLDSLRIHSRVEYGGKLFLLENVYLRIFGDADHGSYIHLG